MNPENCTGAIWVACRATKLGVARNVCFVTDASAFLPHHNLLKLHRCNFIPESVL